MKNEQNVTQDPETPQEVAQAQVAAIREDMSQAGVERTAQERYENSRALGRKYSTEVEIEWHYGDGPTPYVIQLGPVVRISGQLGESNALDTARIEYQNESTPWLELPLGDDDQQAVNEFVRQILVL